MVSSVGRIFRLALQGYYPSYDVQSRTLSVVLLHSGHRFHLQLVQIRLSYLLELLILFGFLHPVHSCSWNFLIIRFEVCCMSCLSYTYGYLFSSSALFVLVVQYLLRDLFSGILFCY